MSTTLTAFRKIAQNQVEPAIYVPARLVSIYISQALVNTPVTPNIVTVVWGLCLLFSSGLLALGSRNEALVAAVLIAFSYVLDCVDGEIARLRECGSDVGSVLEQMVHWITNLTILAGASIGLYRAGGEVHYLLLGMVVLIGDATFHFIYVSLRVAASPGAQYGLLAILTRWQFYLMPISTNLIMLGAIAGQVGAALWIWAVWSNVAWMTAFTLFFIAEARLEGLRRLVKAALVFESPE